MGRRVGDESYFVMNVWICTLRVDIMKPAHPASGGNSLFMRIPIISLEKRKGGGGGHSGSSPKGGSGSPKGSGTGSGSKPPPSVPESGFPPKSKGASSGQGGGKPITIPPGSTFAGRTSGGGTRQQIYGTRYLASL